MTQVTLICVGSLKESYWQQALAEYEKRLAGFCRFRIEELKEERIADEHNAAEVAQALRTEGERILSRIPPQSFRIALCVGGKTYASPGLSPEVKAACDCRLSLSALTFPHQLTRVLLAEVLYRCFAINAGRNYHK